MISELIETLELRENIIKIHVGILHSANIRVKNISGVNINRESLHVLIPSVKISKKHKQYYISQLLASEEFAQIFPETIREHTKILIDKNSASVPVHFIGCCKNDPAKIPDELEAVYEFRINTKNSKINMNRVDLSKLGNVAYAFSLNYENVDSQAYQIRKQRFDCLESIRSLVYAIVNENVSEVEKNVINSDINRLALSNPDLRIINDLVNILSDTRAEDYMLWRKVMLVLATGGGEEYRPIALKFTMRSSHYREIGYFNRVWEEIRASFREKFDLHAIYAWARQDNPVEYTKIVGKSIHKKFQSIMFDNSIAGEITHFHAALILRECVGYKYISQYEGKDKIWYEYVAEDDNLQENKRHKWNKTSTVPPSLLTYISQNLSIYVKRTEEYVSQKLMRDLDPKSDLAEFYKRVITNLHKSFRELCSGPFKNNIANEAFHLFLSPKLTYRVDLQERMLPVGNGIILLGEQPILLEQYHTNIITKHSEIDYYPYDPTNPDIVKVERILRELFHETELDTYEFIMCYFASSLSFTRGPEFLLFIRGGGSNGKTMMADMLTSALGKCFCDKSPSTLLTRQLGDADKPNPAIMSLEHRRVNYFDEFEEGSQILDYNLKSLINGEFSGRQLYQSQKTVVSKARHVAFSNHAMRIKVQDFGTWRRLLYTELKMCFYYENHPQKPYDPNNSYHRIRNDAIKDVYIHTQRAKEAMLSILVKWYQIFTLKYGGSLNAIPRCNISEETERFRISQDTINQFVTTRVVRTNAEFITSIMDVATKYIEWYKENVSRKDVANINVSVATELLVRESYLKDFDCIHGDSIYGYSLQGYRALALNEIKQSEEDFIKVQKNKAELRDFVSADHNMKMEDYYKFMTSSNATARVGATARDALSSANLN